MEEKILQIEVEKKGIPHTVKLPKKDWKEIQKLLPKSPHELMKEMIGNDRLYNQIHSLIVDMMEKSMPEEVECAHCGEMTSDRSNPAFQFYVTQMQTTYFLSVSEFVNLIDANKRLYRDKETISKLALLFLQSFRGKRGQGLIYFKVTAFVKATLEVGFLSLSEMFKAHSAIENLKYINNSLDEVNRIELLRKMYDRDDPNFLEYQKEFFLGKKDYYLTQLEIEKAEDLAPKKSSPTRPDRTDLAFFAHYLSTAKIDYFESHFPSVKAWKQLSREFGKSAKNIQLKYNEIRKNDNRILSKYAGNMEYVINSMLTPYPKAQSIAQDELKLAKLK